MQQERKLYILARDENIFHPHFLDVVLARRPENYSVVGAAMVKSRDSALDSVRYVMRLGGLSSLARLLARVAVRKIRAVTASRRATTVRGVLAQHAIPVVDIASPNDDGFLDELGKLQPDVVFCAVPNILKPRILQLPTLGCVNRHAGRLPFYRGLEPVFHALRKGEPEVTVTYHTMAVEIDAGTILWEHHEPVRATDTVYSLYGRLFHASALGFWQALDALGSGRVVDVSEGSYFTAPTDAEIREFRRLGRRYV